MFLNISTYIIGRPLAWLICIYHLIEILFKALFAAIDGKPDGPDHYPGEIGSIISNKNDDWKTQDKVIRFKEARKGLVRETDHKYDNHDDHVLHQLCLLVQNGPDR